MLSVGDIGFKNKAVRKMNEFREKANGLIFISHDLEQMRMLCDRVIVLDNGKCVFEGDTEKGCIAYEQIIRKSKMELQEISKIKNDFSWKYQNSKNYFSKKYQKSKNDFSRKYQNSKHDFSRKYKEISKQ